MSPLDLLRAFDEALDWGLEHDPLLEPEPAPAPWPLDDAVPLDAAFEV